jgi:DNA primase
MSDNVGQIKNRLNIVDVIGSYLKLEKAGINFKARCPFHREKTPSFFVSPSRDSFYCFGCGKKGDIFNFVQEFEGVDFRGSLKILADRAGVKLEKIDPKLIDQKERLYELLERCTSFYQKKLKENKEASLYLEKRGLDQKTIDNFRLGFAPDAWQEMLNELRSCGYSEKEISDTGMSKTKEDDRSRVYDRFRSRIMFPVMDPSERVIAFSGRIFPPDGTGAKYLNSPETKLFKKSEILFGYDKAKLDIRKSDFAILVEGNVDVLMAHFAGYRNTVAPLGTALTREQVEKLSKLTKKLVIAFDSDSAGFSASSRGARIALSMGMDLKVALIPEGGDPADLILKSPDGWRKAIKESKHIVEFYLEKLAKVVTDKRTLGLKIREEVLPFVAMIDNKIDQAHFMGILAEKMNVPESAVLDEIKKINVKDLDLPYVADNQDKALDGESSSKRKNIIKRVASILLWQDSLKENSSIDIRENLKELERITAQKNFLEKIEVEEKEGLIFEASISLGEKTDIQKELTELLVRLEEDYLKEEFNKKMKELKEAESNKDSKLISKILEECNHLSISINELKQLMQSL